jgi:hypothetical protein
VPREFLLLLHHEHCRYVNELLTVLIAMPSRGRMCYSQERRCYDRSATVIERVTVVVGNRQIKEESIDTRCTFDKL